MPGTLRRLCEFLAYDYDPIMCNPNRKNHHTIGGNAIRFRAVESIREDLCTPFRRRSSWAEGNPANSRIRITPCVDEKVVVTNGGVTLKREAPEDHGVFSKAPMSGPPPE